jgi:glycine oxidase
VTHSSADIAVLGAGVAGLSAALALADTGLDVALISDARAGEASPAAGGILDTGHGFNNAGTQRLMRTARDLWPAYVAMLAERTGVSVALNRDGVLELATTLHDAERLRRLAGDDVDWLDAASLVEREPQLTHALGALHFRHDGALNPLILLKALKQAVGRHVHVRVMQQTVTAIAPGRPDEAVSVTLGDGSSLSAMRVVIAGGAWSSTIVGIPMHLPVAPVRGQLMSVASKALRHVVMLGSGYAIPRGDGRTILGGTEENTGFDPQHTAEGAQQVRALAAAILPSLGTAGMLSTWAGLRPMTRDGLPIIGPDPEHPSVIYACGHGKNGILLTPMSGALVAAAATGKAAPTDSTPFSPLRFSQ